MKNILLLGDSIRMGYDSCVKEILDGKANVFFPDENCRFAEFLLRGISDWAAKLQLPEVNVVHWNTGLWDVLHMGASYVGGDGEAAGTMTKSNAQGISVYEKEPLTPPEIYGYYLKRIHVRLRNLFPKASLVFATTTPVVGEEAAGWAFRSNDEIRQYNQIARDVLTPLGSMINELGDFSAENCSQLHSDWVHYQEEGYRKLAGEIVDFLRMKKIL